MVVDFGTKTIKKVVDDNGSTKDIEVNYVSGLSKLVFRIGYSMRYRVTNKDEEKQVIERFTSKTSDTKYLDPQISIERSQAGNKNGYYYVVCSWKELRDTVSNQSLMELIDRV